MIALEPTSNSVKAARRFVAGFLDGHRIDVRDTVVLLVSELVSNAVEHGGPHAPGSKIGVGIDARAAFVRVEVSDTGVGEPRPGNGAVDRPSGRGLLLVQELSSRWGWDRLPVGKAVWFEIDRPDGGDQDG